MQLIRPSSIPYGLKKKSVQKVRADIRSTKTVADTRSRHNIAKLNPGILLTIACFLVMGILLFNARLLLMGDDADYILDAYRFAHTNTYPALRSSLYTITLSIPVKIFGINIILLKGFSFLCALTGFVFLYSAFYRKIPNRLLYPVLIFSAINSSMQYYSSSNLSEAFFMMIQYGFIGTVFLLIRKLENKEARLQKYWLYLGLAGLALSLSKNIAIVAPISVAVYFVFRKEWKNVFFAFGSFLLFKIPYEIAIRFLYKENTLVDQWSQVLAKNLYQKEQGQENIVGFIKRFLENTRIYFSRVALKEFGLEIGKSYLAIAAFLLTLLLLYGLFLAFKRNKYMFFAAIYLACMCGGTFFALQPAVAQERIILILVPLILLLMLFALDSMRHYFPKRLRVIHTAGWSGIIFFILFTNLSYSASKIQETWPMLQESLADGPTYGYTPDWVNYLEMGKWVKKHIPDDIIIAARKPSSLSIYSSGRAFKGIYSCPTNLNATQLLIQLKKDNIRYLIVASLRLNAKQYIPHRYITTMRNYLVRIAPAYKNVFQLVHKIGKTETCYLVKINYPPGLK